MGNNKVEYINKKARSRHRLIVFSIAGAFALIILLLGGQIIASRHQLSATRSQITASQQDYKDQKKKKNNLSAQVKMLNNKDYLQQLVRAKYYYTKKGETVYSFPQNSQIGNE